MALLTTPTGSSGELLVRDEIWSKRVQEELEETLFAQTIVEWVSGEFADGDVLTIPTLASMQARDYTENANIIIDDPAVGEFQLTIDQYIQSAVMFSDKLKQDTFYMEVLMSKFPQQVVRALLEHLEDNIFKLHKQQTNNDANTINGAAHRFVGGGTGNAITLDDFAKAKLALDRADVSKNGRYAVLDPVSIYTMMNTDNVFRQDTYGPNSVLKDGFGGTHFVGRYAGFEVFESNMLDKDTALDYETGGSLVANIFCGEECFMGAIREMPDIEYIRDGTKKRDIYNATMRYGTGLYRPESFVTVLTKQTA